MERYTGRRTRTIAVLLAAIVVLSGISVVPAHGAPMNYTPSFVEAPAYILNDHTPFGVRFAAAAGSGLPEGTYYMKVRIANTDSRSTWDTSLHRGFTYDPVTNHWEQEREDWIDCPTVTVAADGSVANTWIYGKFGDETVSGTRYIHVALSATGDGTTYNPTVVPQVTVLDTKTQGGWAHNGTEDATLDGKRAAIRASDASTTNGDPNSGALSVLYSLWEAQENGVDDDSDGLVDAADPDENYGLQTSNLGDYRMSAPLSALLDIYVNRTKLRNDDFTLGTQADCDIAVPTDAAEGTADITAPGAIADLAVAVHGQSIDLTWTAGTDNADGSGVGGYRVYRWAVPTSADPVPYTPLPVCIATASGTTAAYSDTTFANDVEYAYEVRVEDVATNISPRSNMVTVTAPAAPIVLTPVYRFFNARLGTHFYTADEAEKANVIATLSGTFAYEGPAYGVNPAVGTQSLWRFFNRRTGTHFYTASDTERDSVNANLGYLYTFEGPAYNVSAGPLAGALTVYRFYNVQNGTHFYTADEAERDHVRNTLGAIYQYEGPAFWAGQ